MTLGDRENDGARAVGIVPIGRNFFGKSNWVCCSLLSAYVATWMVKIAT